MNRGAYVIVKYVLTREMSVKYQTLHWDLLLEQLQ
jgi:hypothetical protein